MTRTTFPFLCCPLDGLPLTATDKSALCATGHCFDFDKRGTLNLLPVQFKKSLEPGDSPEMVQARSIFLDSGFYRPIADFLLQCIAKYGPASPVILDAGCGEGYYTCLMAGAASHLMGMDISKHAVAAAAKRSRDVTWLTGTNAHIPVLDGAVDIVASLFGFPVWAEFRRILKSGGIVIAADPGPMHLVEMRRILYPEIKDKPEKSADVQGFESPLVENLVLTRPAPDAENLHRLVMMTPHGYRTDAARIQKATEIAGQDLTIDIVFRIYRVTV